ncbi:MAG: sugar ABC transporter permease [Rhodobacteraceae bacterium]|nr:sugar ABC transporter permease [Paracoccaceae bacterium]
MVVVLACIWLIFNFLTGGKFLTARNLFNLSLQVAVVGIMACGMVLVIVSRNIDLSVGSQLGFIGVFGALFQTAILPVDGTATWWLTCLVMLATGVLIGFTQGALIAYAGIPSFVVTLGGLLFFRNAAWLINQGRTISPLNETYQRLGGGLNGTLGSFWSWVFAALAIGCIVLIVIRARQRRSKLSVRQRSGLIDASFVIIWSAVVIGFALVMNAHTFPRTDVPMGIAIPVLILIVVAAATSVLARAHTFGRHVFAMGGNPDSAELAGIDTRRLTVIVFAAMGFLCGLAAIVVTARLNAGASVTGTMTELNVIAAAVVGGTSLAGGVGTILGGLIGALIMQSLENGMILMGVPTPLQKMLLALVLIGAVWLDMIVRRRGGT